MIDHDRIGGYAQFGKVAPLSDENNALLRVGGHVASRRINLGYHTTDAELENGGIIQVSPEGAFQPGQQILFWLTVYNGPSAVGDNWISRVRIKPWFKRATLEKRGPGDPGNSQPAGLGWVSPDEQQYGSGPVAAADASSSVHAENNRLVWFPVVKLLDITQYQATNPPPAAPPRHSDSLFLDELWTLDLQDPNDAAYAATQGLTQPNFGRSASFLYISHGYALGLTSQITLTGQGQNQPDLFIDLTWATGAL